MLILYENSIFKVQLIGSIKSYSAVNLEGNIEGQEGWKEKQVSWLNNIRDWSRIQNAG